MLPRVVIHNAVSADGRLAGLHADMERCHSLASTWDEHATPACLPAPRQINRASNAQPCGAQAGASQEAGRSAAGEGEAPDGSAESGGPAGDGDADLPLLVVPDSRGRVRN
jgi:hypothetical protein